MDDSWEPDFFVADWRVRPALSQLERGDVIVSVEARSMQVLTCLARHTPNVVSKQRLIREVWGEAFVSDEVLSHAIWELRKAFGDEARKPRFIQTIAKKGYRLLAEVSYGRKPEPLAAGCRIGHYEILNLVGGGAMGEVYKARDLRLGRVVALKFLPADLTRDPGARRRFLREAQAVAQIEHPNVATIYETGESEGGRVFLALAFYEGLTLQQKLENGPLPLPEALGIARQIARGLAAAHRREIVHRDIKPANIIVLDDGTVKVLDFGLAKLAGATTLTGFGISPGTPAYKSPEQTKGEKVDPRSDLWALGVVLYEMVTGRVPFGGEYEQAVIYSILNEPPRPLDGAFPAELARVIERALAKDPAARYQTADEFERDLERIPLESSGEVRQQSLQTHRPSRRRAVWIAAAVALILVLGGIGIGWQRWIHRWDPSPEVALLVEQGNRMEGRGDMGSSLSNAERLYRQALSRDPENPIIAAQLAALLVRIDGQFPAPARRREIRELAARAVEQAPEQPMPWVAQAKLFLLEGKYHDAERAARKAIDKGPDFDRGYTILGEALIEQGHLEDGLQQIRHAVTLGEGALRARLVLAARLLKASRYEEAAAVLQKVLELDPDHPTANNNLGNIYLRSGRTQDALPLFRRVLEVTHDARAANNLGFVYFDLDRMDKAIQTFEEAHKLNPSLYSPPQNLGESYEKIGNGEQALRWYAVAVKTYDTALAQGGSRDTLLSGRAFCVAKLGHYEEALRNIQEALAFKPKDNELLFRAAQVYAVAGHREEALAYVQRAVQEGYSREELRRDLTLSSLKDDPRFRAALDSEVP